MSWITKTQLALRLFKAKFTKKNQPLIVNWAITGRCNLRCKHCYGNYGNAQKDELSFYKISETIKALKKMGTKRITIEGGEPLVHPQIDDIMELIYNLKMELSVCTNGVLLDKHIPALKKYADLIVLSLDGQKAYHDDLRGEGNYEKVIEAAKTAREHKMRVLIFSTLIDKNINDIDFLIQKAQELNVYITFNIAVSALNESGNREDLSKADADLFREALRKIRKAKSEGKPVYYSDDNYRQAETWDDYSREVITEKDLNTRSARSANRFSLIPCFAGKRYCYIECNGDVYPCYQRVGIFKPKNILNNGIKEAFSHIKPHNDCLHCYNLTLSELNLQSNLNMKSVFKAFKNYMKP